MEIVSARPADGEALRDLHVKTWAMTFRGRVPVDFYRECLGWHRIRDWADVLRERTADGGGVLAAHQDGLIVGLCEYGPTVDADDDPGKVGQVHRLYVNPAYHRQGIGRSLLTTVIERFRAAGMAEATLWVLEQDERSRAFYERVGWQPDGGVKVGSASDVRYRQSLH